MSTFDTVRINVFSAYDENWEAKELTDKFQFINTFDLTEDEMYDIIGDYVYDTCCSENASRYPDTYFTIKDSAATVYATESNYLDIKEALAPFVFDGSEDDYDEDEAGEIVWECIDDKDWDRLGREMDSSEAVTLHVGSLRSTAHDAEYYFGEGRETVEKLFQAASRS